MSETSLLVFQTERLLIRVATIEDVDLFYRLWTDPQVMANVGFPNGLRITRVEIEEKLSRPYTSVFDRLLVAVIKNSGPAMGEVCLAAPNESGITEPDIKLLPVFWGHGYGAELWRGIVAYQFMNTGCTTVQTTPNVANSASIKMMEAVGGIRTGDAVHNFPDSMCDCTKPVHYYVYRLSREEWKKRQDHVGVPSNADTGFSGFTSLWY